MNYPEHQAGMPPVPESALVIDQQPLTARQAACGGALMAPFVLFIGQVVEPITPLSNITSYAVEGGLYGGLVLAGGLACGGITYFNQLRRRRRAGAAATPEAVAAVISGFEGLLAEASPKDQS